MQIDFSRRSDEIEIMDDLDCHGLVVEQTLHELDIINRWLGGNGITIDAVIQLLRPVDRPCVVVDMGCGSGEMLRLLVRQVKDRRVGYVGIDANPNIVRYAEDHSSDFPSISYKTIDIFSDEFRQLKADVVVATLFLHHFDEEQLVNIFCQLKQQASVGVVVNDLHRHPLAYYSFKLISTLFSRSAMVKFDGPLSVLRGFKKDELKRILKKAGIENYSLQWRWAFRWRLIIPTAMQGN